ncbi:MAG: T9SS type A sorting domain-containing protein, partial [Ginsengibacter sp.]
FAPVFNGLLYFTVNDLQFYPLWQTDGTTAGTKLAAFQNTTAPAQSQSSDFKFAVFNSELYFSGECGSISLSFQPCKLTSGPLPLTWLGVHAQWINESEVKVSWRVADQKNVKDYTVEFSNDGSHFKNVCSVIASPATSYNCTVPANSNDKNYYRVMQRDIDNKVSYSDVISLNASAATLISVYPNPAQNKLYIQGINNFSQATISDVSGKVLTHAVVNSPTRFIDISVLSKGIYFIKFTSAGYIKTIKFIKE